MLEPIPRKEIEDRIKEIESDKNLPDKVSERLSNPHPVTVATKEWYESSETYWTRKTRKPVVIPISVEKSSFSRALRIVDFLAKLLEARGHSFQKDRNDFSVVLMSGRELHFSMRNIGKYVEDKSTSYNYRNIEYTDNLCIQFYEDSWNRKEWKDTPYSKLEKKIIRVVAYAELYAEYSHRFHLQLKEQWRLRDIELEKEREIKRKIEEEKKKVQELFQKAEECDKVQKVVNYLKSRKKLLLERDLFNDDEVEYYAWGLKQCQLINPLSFTEE